MNIPVSFNSVITDEFGEIVETQILTGHLIQIDQVQIGNKDEYDVIPMASIGTVICDQDGLFYNVVMDQVFKAMQLSSSLKDELIGEFNIEDADRIIEILTDKLK